MPKTNPKYDLTGKRFGRLLIMGRSGTRFEKILWECLCDCGKTTYVVSQNLKNGTTRSCGCLRSELVSKTNKEHVGEKASMFGRKGRDHPASRNTGEKNPAFGKVYRTHGEWINLPNGERVYMRSSYEKRVINLLTERNIDYLYEPKTFSLGDCTYTPDIYFPKENMYLEIKGYLRMDAKVKLLKFFDQYPAENLRIAGLEDIIKMENSTANERLDIKNAGTPLSSYLNKDESDRMYFNLTLSHEFDCLYDYINDSIYGAKLLDIEGISEKHLDVGLMSHAYFTEKLSNMTIDSNANANEGISPNNYGSEIVRGIQKIEGYYLIHRYATKRFGLKRANDLLRSILIGDLYFHDASGIGVQQPYCFAMSTTMIMIEGRPYGSLHSLPPKRADSFISQAAEVVMDCSQIFCGALALGDIFVNYAWYSKKENLSDKRIIDDYQKLIHILNNAFRIGGQSPFTNFSLFDRPNLEKVFGNHVYPDGSKPDFEYIMHIQKIFAEWFAKGDPASGLPYRFPICTMNLCVSEDKKIIDRDFLDFVSKVNLEKGVFNIYINDGFKISSCCRLVNDSSRMQFKADTLGNGGVQIGSHRVVTLNLPRLALKAEGDQKKFYAELDIVLESARDLLQIHREEILQRRVDRGFLRFFKPLGWFTLNHLFSTIGIIGVSETNKLMGFDITSEEGTEFTTEALNYIEEFARKSSVETGHSFNVEEIPGESVASKLCQKDKVFFGDEKVPFELYSNQYIPLIEDVSLPERIITTGKFMEILSGGGILHLNVSEKITDPTVMKHLIEYSVENGVSHLAINYGFGTCKNGHTSICGNLTKCPECGDEITQYVTRIIGYFSVVDNWNRTRREFEFPRRVFK